MGDGGKGKTAIAYEFAWQIKERAPTPFQYVIWMSGKRRRFVEGEIRDLEPDFSDLRSALKRLLLRYGLQDGSLSDDEARDLSLYALRLHPALVVVDDIDSLEGVEEAATEFFTVDVPGTGSKVLLTSRRTLAGLGATTTVVEGFQDQDGRAFIDSRVDLYSLDPKPYNDEVKSQVLAATDRSPLFINDLMRRCAQGVPVFTAVKEWSQQGGSKARVYALNRELGMLSASAKQALYACCIPNSEVALSDIEDTTGMTREDAELAVAELQRLFLVPKPIMIADLPRFNLNVNTRALVRAVAAENEQYKRIERAWLARSAEYLRSPKRLVRTGGYISQAVGLKRQGEQQRAEETLLAGLKEYPDDPDLLAQLGWLYKRWQPPRIADARDTFEHARRQGCANAQMYFHWSELEYAQSEWLKSAQVAEAGLKASPDSPDLAYRAGFVHHQIGKRLRLEWQPRAGDEFRAAYEFFSKALSAKGYRSRQRQSSIYRGLLLTIESLIEWLATDSDAAQRRTALAHEALALLERWRRDHPDDLNAYSESDRVEPLLRRVLTQAEWAKVSETPSPG